MVRRPRNTTKKALLSPLASLGLLLLQTADGEDDEITAMLVLALAVRPKPSGRYGPRGAYSRDNSARFCDLLLEGFSEKLFRTFCRMSRTAFWHVHDLIKDDPIFISKGRRPQRPVKYQLIAFLVRFGGIPGIKTAGVIAQAEGTVSLYSKRICQALRNIRTEHLFWPGKERKEFLKGEMSRYGFPGCLGMVDGSLIRLRDRPLKDPWSFYCRKKFYALLIQVVCDHRGIIIEYELGWPGSVADTMAFKQSELWKNRGKYFEDDEYILADKGYPLTKFTIRPFAEYDLTNDPVEAQRRRRFNRTLSRLRVKVEHAFGMLKGRFAALRDFPGWDVRQMWRFIESFMILHNILVEQGDDPTEIDGFNGEEDSAGSDDEMEDSIVREARGRNRMSATLLYRTGLHRRKLLMQYISDNKLYK